MLDSGLESVPDGEVVSVTGLQLKSMISQFAKQAVKEELACVLAKLTAKDY